MTKEQQVLANAEAFVREVVAKDFKQDVDDKKVHALARKASKAIPLNVRKVAREKISA